MTSIKPFFLFQSRVQAQFGMVDSFLNPGAIALEHISVPVEHIEVGHSLVYEGWQDWLGELVIRAHVCIMGKVPA